MQLSEAIRLGAMLGPKADGEFFGPNGGSCAMGAGLRAMGYNAGEVDGCTTSARIWPWVRERIIPCPVAACDRKDYPAVIIAHLSNSAGHDWDRNRNADFVATIEPQETTDVLSGPSEHTELVNDCERV